MNTINNRPPDLRHVPEFRWHDSALATAELFGLDPEHVEEIVRKPLTVTIDRTTDGVGRLTERRTVGDVTAIVRYDENEWPIILGVYLRLPIQQAQDRERMTSGGASGSHKRAMPTTMRALRKAIIATGCRIVSGGSHDKVISPEGKVVMTIPITPSDHRSIPNCVADLRRKGYDI